MPNEHDKKEMSDLESEINNKDIKEKGSLLHTSSSNLTPRMTFSEKPIGRKEVDWVEVDINKKAGAIYTQYSQNKENIYENEIFKKHLIKSVEKMLNTKEYSKDLTDKDIDLDRVGPGIIPVDYQSIVEMNDIWKSSGTSVIEVIKNSNDKNHQYAYSQIIGALPNNILNETVVTANMEICANKLVKDLAKITKDFKSGKIKNEHEIEDKISKAVEDAGFNVDNTALITKSTIKFSSDKSILGQDNTHASLQDFREKAKQICMGVNHTPERNIFQKFSDIILECFGIKTEELKAIEKTTEKKLKGYIGEEAGYGGKKFTEKLREEKSSGKNIPGRS
jgi:hypothetical protein